MITGQCLCGAVRYRASEDPLASRTCWCRLCQYLGAGSATVNVCFRKDSVSIEGELQDFALMSTEKNSSGLCSAYRIHFITTGYKSSTPES